MKRSAFAVLAVLLAASAPAAAEQIKSQTGYKLTQKGVDACQGGFLAVYKEAAKNPALKAELQNMPDMGEDDSLDQFAGFMKAKAPLASGILQKNGCAPEELAKQMSALVEAGFAAMAAQAGGKTADLDPVIRENAAFLQANQGKFEKMQAEIDAAQKAAGLSESDPEAEEPAEEQE
ncbi:MAG TPA: hypothetical protein VEB20_02690 [Azospirillaceae bacterium]|nr:hypothetical protein [Azospirillaceae bacterium]